MQTALIWDTQRLPSVPMGSSAFVPGQVYHFTLLAASISTVRTKWCHRSFYLSVILQKSVFMLFGHKGKSAFIYGLNVCYFVNWSSVRNAEKLHKRLIRWRLLSLSSFLPIEDISFHCAICVSTLPYQETINTTICGLATSPVIPPNQIMTNWKKQGE